jgi:hypothetical protein
MRPIQVTTVRPTPSDGCCARCRRRPVRGQLVRDHDHQTGEFRAWVCSSCNLLIGLYEHTINNPDATLATRAYLERHSPRWRRERSAFREIERRDPVTEGEWADLLRLRRVRIARRPA